MEFVEPEFHVDENGRVFCKSHSKYKELINTKDYFRKMFIDRELSCLSCIHYINNDCFFPKSEIDKIEFDRTEKKEFICHYEFAYNLMNMMVTFKNKIK